MSDDYTQEVKTRKKLQRALVDKLRDHIDKNLPDLQDLLNNHYEIIEPYLNTIWKTEKPLILFKDKGLIHFHSGLSTGIVYLDINSGKLQLDFSNKGQVEMAEDVARVMEKKPFYIYDFTYIDDYDIADVLDHKDNYALAIAATSANLIMDKATNKEKKRANRIQALLDNTK